MLIRLTVPVILLVGLLLTHIWTGDLTASAYRLQEFSHGSLKENSFSCLLDNERWEADSLTAELIRHNQLTTIYMRSGIHADKLVFLFSGNVSPGAYALDNPSTAYAYVSRYNEQCPFTTDEYYQGMLMIDFHDEASKQLTGSFELLAYSDECRRIIRIHNGRFNVRYREREIR